MTTTLTDLARPEFDWDPHLDVDDPVPVLSGNQAQGDVYILRADTPGVVPLSGDGQPIGAGFDIVEGQGIRNPHTLVDLGGRCRIIAGTAGYDHDVATLVVPAGAECFLVHPQHGANGIGAGTFVLRRQREQAEQVRVVAD